MKKKHLVYMLVILLLIFLIGAMIIGLYISERLSSASVNDYLWEDKGMVKSHVLVIVDDSGQTYDSTFEAGILETAEAYHIAIEIKRVEHSNYIEDMLHELDKAMYAGMDGVIVHAVDDQRVVDKVQLLHEAGIPVVALNHDILDSPRITYVGVNRYDIGYVAGESLAKALDGKGSIVVIAEKGYLNSENASEDLMLLGLKEVIKAYPELVLERMDYTEQGVLSAETVALDIIRSGVPVNGIFCTSGSNTLGVVQMMIDNNMVNNLQLVGYGNDPEILEYITKGNIVDASIVTNYGDIGRESVLALVEFGINGFVSSYINTDIEVYDLNNIEEYLQKVGEPDEE